MFEQNKVIDDWNNSSDEYFSNIDYNEFYLELKDNPHRGFPKAMAC